MIEKSYMLIFEPILKMRRKAIDNYCLRHPMKAVSRRFYRDFGRKLNWDNPRDLNEKINWLKFHTDLRSWARLADKYAVREYVEERGCGEYLIPLYGKWDNVEEVISAWDSLPNEFVLKNNNGCGDVLPISNINGGKQCVTEEELRARLSKWRDSPMSGMIRRGEFHYLLIKNCFIAEKLLVDESCKDFSTSPIDYKFHCCDGEPYICYVSYGRDFNGKSTHQRVGNLYDMEWNQRSDLMSVKYERRKINKPKNWEEMIEVARKLSKGHPQARVDLYNIDGKIYFGEMTMTSSGGFDTEYVPELYRAMGDRVTIDLNASPNEYAKF